MESGIEQAFETAPNTRNCKQYAEQTSESKAIASVTLALVELRQQQCTTARSARRPEHPGQYPKNNFTFPERPLALY